MPLRYAKALYSTLWIATVGVLGAILQPATAFAAAELLLLAFLPPFAMLKWFEIRGATMSQLIAKGRR